MMQTDPSWDSIVNSKSKCLIKMFLATIDFKVLSSENLEPAPY